MAKYENEGYCPNNSVGHLIDESNDSRLGGLWSIIGSSVVYEKEDAVKCTPDYDTCNQAFGSDPIAYDLLSAIIRKNAKADKILVRQLHNGGCNVQSITDIQKVLGETTNPQLIVCASSNFAVIIADAEYGLDVWIWALTSCL